VEGRKDDRGTGRGTGGEKKGMQAGRGMRSGGHSCPMINSKRCRL